MNNLSRYYHTIKYLKFKQIFYRLYYRFHTPKINASPSPLVAKIKSTWEMPINKTAKIKSDYTAVFLNESADISKSEIWSDKSKSLLWLYHLHYQNDLSSNPTSQNKALLSQLIQRWLEENPPLKSVGWDPYPISLRVVNWMKWYYAGNKLSQQQLDSLALQVRILQQTIEWHLLGNHLIANAKALVYAGCFFEGDEADTWYNRGMKILQEQIEEQILPDGAHFELSPMYHAIILEDLLDLCNVLKTHQKEIPLVWQALLKKMLQWLANMQHPDNQLAFFNDAALNEAPTLAELIDYAKRLKVCEHFDFLNNKNSMIESGYYRLENKNALVLCDLAKIGPDYIPGHAHADTLSFELSLKGKRLFVNSGTSTYAKDSERTRQRGSSAHNTLTVNDLNSSDVWGGFRVGKRASVQNVNCIATEKSTTLEGTHTGYSHLNNKIFHKRRWTLNERECFIHDEIIGKGSADLAIYYHLHPDFQFRKIDMNKVEIVEKTSNETAASLRLDNSFEIQKSTYHPEFGVSIHNQCLTIRKAKTLPCNNTLTLTWD